MGKLSINLESINASALIESALEDFIGKKAVDAFGKLARQGITEARDNRTFQQFTGQTYSSYMAGVYKNGNVVEIVSKPTKTVRNKIAKGEDVELSHPVEGNARTVTGSVDLVTDTGEELSVKTIKENAPTSQYGMLLTTGTEYSELLEKNARNNKKNLDVLTDTYQEFYNTAEIRLEKLMRVK